MKKTILTLAALAAGVTVADQIVISSDAGKVVKYAAEELQLHLKQISGEDLKIVTDAAPVSDYEYRVGPSKRTLFKSGDFGSQVWTINATDSAVELVGYDDPAKGSGMPGLYDDQGSLYAVYEFLERDGGVIWADSTDYGTIFTKHGRIRAKNGIRRGKPFVSYRGGSPLDTDRYDPMLWKDGTDGAKRYLEFAYGGKSANEINEQKRRFMRRRRLGGEFAPANHSFYWYYDRFWDKASKNFVEYRPELFAKGYVGDPPQLCYSNPETVRQVVEDIRAYFNEGGFKKRYRGVGRLGYIWGKNRYCLEPMDNASFCKCERCVKEYEKNREADKSNQSTHWFRFVNEVAREIKKSHPNKMISTLAYFSHEGLPTGITLEDNVVVYFCISANRTCYSKLLDQQLARMKEWRKVYPNQPIAMWLYNTFPLEIARNGGFHCFPGFFADEAERQYALFRDLDVSAGIFHCGFNGEIDNYMQCRWMLDPSLRAADMLDEYFAGCGAAAKPLKEFYRTVERRYCDKSLYPEGAIHQNVNLAWGVLGDDETMKKLGSLIAEAEAAAKTPFEKGRVECFKLGIWDYMKAGYDSFKIRSAAPFPKWRAKKTTASGGDPDKVDWTSIAPSPVTYYLAGSDTKSSFKDGSVKMANDGEWLYIELTENCDTSKLRNSPGIAPFDTWEILFALQRAQPVRYYLVAPDGRITGESYGEVNWRQGVKASESGHPAYGAKCVTDRTRPDSWTTRMAFPFATMLDKPVKRGDTIYLNVTRVAGGAVTGSRRLFDVFVLNPFTTVHTSDRTCEVVVE